MQLPIFASALATSAANPKFAHSMLHARSRTSGSKADRVQIRVSLVSVEQHLGIPLGTEFPSLDVIDHRASRERDNFIVVCEHGRRDRAVGSYRKG